MSFYIQENNILMKQLGFFFFFFARAEQIRQIETYSVPQIPKMHKMSVSLSCVNSPLALFCCLCHKFPTDELTPSVYVSAAGHK